MEQTINHWMITAKTSGTKAEDLWNDAKDYFMWCEANPIYKSEVIKQTGLLIRTEYPRPFNLPALCIHCGVTVGYINDMSKNKAAGDYHLVAQKILQVIYAQNLEYAMVGIFNSQITIRKLGLGEDSDKSNLPAVVNVTVMKSSDTPALADSEYDKS
jgi:hypothetical protein